MSTATSAEAIANAVGYATPSQSSREYVRLLGQPPPGDGVRLRADVSGSGRAPG